MHKVSPLVLVLVQPAGPINVGSVARLCANFGIDELRLVAPCCNPIDMAAKQMAVHGTSILNRALIYPNLVSALADCRRVVACSGRINKEVLTTNVPEEALSWLLTTEVDGPSALVFGREDRGLSNNELLLAGKVLKLITSPQYTSINLSHAVAIILYELEKIRNSSNHTSIAKGDLCLQSTMILEDPATRLALEGFLSDTELLLLKVGFLYPNTARARMKKLKTLLQRSQITGGEVSLLRGMVRQLHWANRRHSC
uniref:Probable tRNA/rRNA methyltransferase n=1 Tax=Paulinella chromatophora TaxID=39717 RepID=B1X5G5_PAUCH|nr:probable tRNA/rRNA methyltransferase [Paulinella chromatophora]ACB43184.1 probable tRNA/rRNA methyltransferase [Paulinella chromatophora]|eukprot:gb/GEZN01011428.1/.p1 GENE.gb/GEZN01011428.1/~~gb/GEZN01011428.1/.p1  ORF type:complete len:256 (-),score=-13.73 gb/GEZN01011428.1/:240-1007(-)